MKRIIISVTNDLVSDQRVNKVANSLSNAGFSVLLVGRRFSESVKLSQRNYSTYRLKMFFHKVIGHYPQFQVLSRGDIQKIIWFIILEEMIRFLFQLLQKLWMRKDI